MNPTPTPDLAATPPMRDPDGIDYRSISLGLLAAIALMLAIVALVQWAMKS